MFAVEMFVVVDQLSLNSTMFDFVMVVEDRNRYVLMTMMEDESVIVQYFHRRIFVDVVRRLNVREL